MKVPFVSFENTGTYELHQYEGRKEEVLTGRIKFGFL